MIIDDISEAIVKEADRQSEIVRVYGVKKMDTINSLEALHAASFALFELSSVAENVPCDAKIPVAYIYKEAHKALCRIATILGVKEGEK
jgi:hypothetical protein